MFPVQLTLIKREQIYTYDLPEKISGQYWVAQADQNGEEEKIISVEGIEDHWHLKSNKNVVIQDEKSQKVKDLIIEPLCLYSILLKNSNEKVFLFSEPATEDRRTFKKLLLPVQGKLLIGRGEDCDICFSNIFVSSIHAEITVTDNEVKIKDLNSSNGTFVNGVRVESKVMEPGDVIYIIGLKIIYGKGFIAINNPDGKIRYNQAILRKYIEQKAIIQEEEQDDEESILHNQLFYRSPRLKRDIEKLEIKIDPPPAAGSLEQIPLALMLGPSITMGMTSLFTGLLTLQNVMRTNGDIMMAAPTLMMSFSMLLGTILWPILQRHERKNV